MSPTAPEPSPTQAQESWLCVELVERLESGQLELPVMPDAAAQVMSLCSSAESDARKLAGYIQRDQAFASHLLRVANSPVYAPTVAIVSLQQAVARLGFSNLSQIAMAVALKSKVFVVPGFEDTLRIMWRHAALAGAYAKEIARLRRRNVEGAFLCGLLHDVGKPVILQATVDLHRARGQTPEPIVVEAAMDALHERVGSQLAAKWSMPEWMHVSLAQHHSPSHAGEHADEARTTALADRLAHWADAGDEQQASTLRLLPVVKELNLYGEEWNLLIAARERVLAVAEAFG